MSRRQVRNRSRKFARAIELEALEARQLLTALPDLIVTSAVLTSSTISQGQNDHIDWTVENSGTADAQPPDAGNWYDAVVATTDTTFDPNSSNNKYLAFPGNPNGLDVGGTYTQGTDFGTFGWAPGTYHVYVIADDGNWLTESNENNNVSAPQTLTIDVPDLTVALNSATPSPVALNKTLNLNWTVTNSPSSIASTETNWTDIVWISPNPTLDTSNPAAQEIGFFGNVNTSPLAPGNSYTTSTTSPPQVSIPTNIAPGTYYIFVQTNQFSGQSETNTANDTSNPIAIQVTAADLVVSKAQADSSTHNVGDTIPISWTVKNQGNATADGAFGGDDWHDAVYWSYSSTFDGNAHWIGDVDYTANDGGGALAPGASYASPQELGVNTSGWDGGQYYFFVKTDWYGWQEPESNENNNVSAAIPVFLHTGAAPDMTVTLNSTGSQTAQIGSNLEVNFTVKNSASASASTGDGNTWWDAVWLSPSPTLDTSDSQVIGYWWNGNPTSGSLPLAPGASYTQDGTVQIPTNMGTGQFYIIIGDDTFNNIQESNGANNLSNAIPVTVNGSDLQMNDFQVNGKDANGAPDIGEIPLGQPFNVQWNVSNQGNEPTQNEYSDAVYISQSSTFNAATAQLVYYSTEPDGGPLDNGDNYTKNATITLTSLPDGPGTYYMFAVTDAFDDEPEGNENNNVSSPIQFEVTGPDLALTSATVDNFGISSDPNSVILDQDFNISWAVSNPTNDSINAGWNDSVYISTSSTFDPSNASLILSFQPEPSGMGADASYSTGFDYTLSSQNYAPGQYYIYVVTDDGNVIPESNENNNIATIPITVLGADLVVTNASVVPTETLVGSSLQVNWTVQNQGEAVAYNGWVDAVYISNSPIFNPNTAFNLGGQFEGRFMNPGDSYSDSTSVDLSSFPKDGGQYYLFVVTDVNNNQPENNENNNVSAAIPLTLDPTSQADLTTAIDTSGTDPSAVIGNDFNVQWTDSNIGTAPTTSDWNDEVWLSPTHTFDPNTAIGLGLFSTGGGTIFATLNMPTNIGVGTFYLFVQTDVDDDQAESTYTNNISDGVPIVVQGSDLTVTDTSLPEEAPATALDGTGVYAGGLTGYYYGTGSDGVSGISDAENYIASNAPLAQFVASQLQYPGNQGLGGTEDDSNNLASFLGGDSLTFSNPALLSSQLDGQIMEFDGYISLPAGPTTLWVGSDDGAEMFIGGSDTPFIADTGPHPFTWNGNTYDAATAGLYAVKIIYYEDFGGTGVGLATGPDTNDLQTVPSSDLYSPNPKIVSNQQFEIDWTVANQGNITTQSNFWFDAVYLSPTPVFDPNTAILLTSQGNANGDFLGAGNSYGSFADVQIPASLGGGTKYLFVQADEFDYEQEGNEDNNLSAPIPITVLAPDVDLEPTSFTAPYTAVAGETLAGPLQWTVVNNGNTNANGDWNDELYLSQNPWIDSTSIQLGMFDADNYGWDGIGGFGSTYSTDQSNTVSIPEGVSPGNYYLILAVNGDHGQGEADFTNNTLVHPINILSLADQPPVFTSWSASDGGAGSPTAQFTFNTFISAGSASFTVVNEQTGQPVNGVVVSFDSDTVTFSLPSALAGGAYQFTLPAGSVVNISDIGNSTATIETILLVRAGQTFTMPASENGIVVNRLVFGAGGTLDIGNNTLSVEYDSDSDPAGMIGSLLTSGDANGKWNGTGIVSSTVASDASNTTGVGYFDNGTKVVITRSWNGDTNLDGVINADDLSLMMLGQSESGTRWQDGNFNYDAQVDADDWIKLMYGVAYSRGQKLNLASVVIAASVQETTQTDNSNSQPATHLQLPAFGQTPINTDDADGELLDEAQPVL